MSRRWPFAFSLLLLVSACSSKRNMFEQQSASHTGIEFTNKLEPRDQLGILYYIYYYNGGGVATGDINNDGLTDVFFTANSHGGNKLCLNKGNFKFEDITSTANVAGNADWCTGVTMADVNGDGYLDIYVSAVANVHGLFGHNELYINNRNGTFTERSKEYGLDFSGFSTQAAFFDYDHDGDLDCYLLNQSFRPDDNIVDTSNRRKTDLMAGDRLYRNELSTGANRFVDVSAAAGIFQGSLGYGLGLAVSDLNNDGWDDIYVGNDFHENDYYYVNNSNGTFTESGASHFGHYSRFSMGNDIADYNNDGQPDIITVDMLPSDEKILKTYGSNENPDIYHFKLTKNGFQDQYSRNCLQRNNGDGRSFSEAGLLAGVAATDWSWSPLFADFDNDGLKDLFISSGIVKRPGDLDFVRYVSNLYMQKGVENKDEAALEKMPDGSSHPYFFHNMGDGHFSDSSNSWGTGDMKGYYNGSSYADLDNDGKLDVVINQLNGPAVILRNTTASANHLAIHLKGEGMNRFGISAKVYLYQGKSFQYQQLMLTRGFQSSSEPVLHFGLKDGMMIDSLLVVWPDQRFQWIKNIDAGKQLTLSQSNAAGHFEGIHRQENQLLQASSIKSSWSHQEDAFDDFNVQYLIPHAESTRGPKLAVSDVNGDGLDDIFACGAKGQRSAMLIQSTGVSFIDSDTALFNADRASEDVDAIFVDVNGDGKQDLYVVSGGNEYQSGNPLLQDRLYINDGKGHFTKSVDALPLIRQNKSCVVSADIDKDGDNDLFVGTLADASAYGVPQTSFLLINDGQGHFTTANTQMINLNRIGLVTSADIIDIDHNGWPDLIVAGEWMPITVFLNTNGRFEAHTLPASSGQWQTIRFADVNGDGKQDFLAGNWGLNNKFSSQKDGPIRLYVNDFDGNGKVDHLLSYMSNGQEYPFLAKDEVERALPALKKHYLSYSEYAGIPMKEVFYGYVDTVKPLICEKLASVAGYGDGKGNFKVVDLPDDLQISPIFAFCNIGNSGEKRWAVGGNFYDVIPYEGRYDGQALKYMRYESGSLISFSDSVASGMRGQVRDLKQLRIRNNQPVLVAAKNGQPLSFYVIKGSSLND